MSQYLARKKENCRNKDIFLFLLYSFLLAILIIEAPNKLQFVREHFHIVGLVGVIGISRYSLWVIHLVRAQIYEKYVYSKLSKQAENLPEKHWLPERLYFLLVSYGEDKKILYNSVKSIIYEAKTLNLPATICMGSASSHDEKILSEVISSFSYGNRIKVVFVRQNEPNKRLQIGRALRALVREGIKGDDPVMFMDGDSIIIPGCLRKCLPIFKLRPNVHSVTTNEKAIVKNSGFFSNLLNLRFAIRNFHMNSLSLSKRILCLTGRFSIFRANQISNEDFIQKIENDYIKDWYWNRIQFMTGDDKSTWFSLLKRGAEMLYIPDAFVYTIEKVSTNPIKDYIENLKRWSGNMLRNNGRALALGPEKTGLFPWFILLDQRISMWTAIISPSVIILTMFRDIQLTFMLIIWMLFIKYLQSLLIFYYGRTINYTYPIIYYLHQFLNGLVKIYMLFNMGVQFWNNQNIKNKAMMTKDRFYFGFAKYITGLYIIIFFLLIEHVLSSNRF